MTQLEHKPIYQITSFWKPLLIKQSYGLLKTKSISPRGDETKSRSSSQPWYLHFYETFLGVKKLKRRSNEFRFGSRLAEGGDNPTHGSGVKVRNVKGQIGRPHLLGLTCCGAVNNAVTWQHLVSCFGKFPIDYPFFKSAFVVVSKIHFLIFKDLFTVNIYIDQYSDYFLMLHFIKCFSLVYKTNWLHIVYNVAINCGYWWLFVICF